ncbi:glycosyltransferase [Roseivirga sp. BDSF3-8]|uniref:glycosyltransferase n=1 Tax=Roseivirga sp. BDSF3-8 TaxID=3241598 RepID=UPI00353250E7
MPLILIIWLPLFLLYTFLILYASFRWRTLPEVVPSPAERHLDLTVIIPARNEAEGIISLLNDLALQDYPDSHYEVIVVDDYSEDDTFDLVVQYISQSDKNVRILSVSDSPFNISSPKKNALAYGISRARGTHIVTTDADCRVGNSWLSIHNQLLSRERCKMVAGPVYYTAEDSFLQKAQGLELAALIGTGAVSLAIGKAGMANGANLSFSLEVYKEVDGYTGNEHIVSGDDEFLLRKIHSQSPESVVFAKSQEVVVSTAPCKNLIALFHQRRRWAGKWRLHGDIFSIFLPLFVFLFYLGWLSVIALAFTHFTFIWLILSTFILKTAIEFLFLQPIRILGGKKVSFPVLIVLQLLYPFYVIFFGIAANAGGFRWKGRTYSKHTND